MSDTRETDAATRSCPRCDAEARGLGSSERHTHDPNHDPAVCPAPQAEFVPALVVLHGYDPEEQVTTTDAFHERPEDEGTTSPWHRAVALRDSVVDDFPAYIWSIGLNERARDLMAAENMRRWFGETDPLDGQTQRRCSTPDCPGDGRYAAPGKGHLADCRHLTVRAHPPAVTEVNR